MTVTCTKKWQCISVLISVQQSNRTGGKVVIVRQGSGLNGLRPRRVVSSANFNSLTAVGVQVECRWCLRHFTVTTSLSPVFQEVGEPLADGVKPRGPSGLHHPQNC